ncbi:endonuclease/exonuclease/phosphatase family protein [Sphingomonas sp.]|jgi:endonuclease/exonuclease/phosphatase family metal-dependent hydrolase|uniref:endonuclease/exonuclease/phosphatase family protein n=1 Tax=Sphingomonas sp. TaxID=28214 RepID=UPI002E366E26|nr:endonuclease/exonuclease/phosphatase family protein [Sphingomonas sp.]HEX4693439.1 endonuclease/exonuclease/phosphatase family protein [Sphingomonas sp.]
MIKVASYNIRKGVGTDRIRSPDRILHVLHEIDADIIALQEADRRFGRRAAILPPHHLADHSPWKAVPFGNEQSSGWHGNVLLVRKEAEILDCEAIHLPTLEPRGAVMADLRVNGIAVRVVGMHLDLSGLMRRRQAESILAHLDSAARRLPTVMMGDLNEWTRRSGCLKDFAERFTIAATGPSFHARRPVGRLDRIMASPELRIADCGVHHSPASRTASDHLPIWARVEPS